MLFSPPDWPECGGAELCCRLWSGTCSVIWSHKPAFKGGNGCKSSVRVVLPEEGVLLFVFPYREPKEDGGRNATDCGRPFAKRRFGKQWCEVLAVSLASW